MTEPYESRKKEMEVVIEAVESNIYRTARAGETSAEAESRRKRLNEAAILALLPYARVSFLRELKSKLP